MSIADKLQIITENVPKVYSKGFADGYSDGETNGKDLGNQEAYDAFWNAIQKNGSRVNYENAFSNASWCTESFKPLYKIKPTYALSLFKNSSLMVEEDAKRIDLIALAEETGFEFDFSECTNLGYAFADAGCIKTIGEVDVRLCTGGGSLSYAFYGGYSGYYKTEIKKIICNEDSQFNATTFANLTKLVEIRFEGTIGKTAITFASSTKLSHDSLVSIINALSSTTSNLTITLSKTSVNNAFETSDGTANGSTSSEWASLIATKPNWTISLG